MNIHITTNFILCFSLQIQTIDWDKAKDNSTNNENIFFLNISCHTCISLIQSKTDLIPS